MDRPRSATRPIHPSLSVFSRTDRLGAPASAFPVLWLVELNFDFARHFEVSHPTIAVIGDVVDEFHTALFQLPYGFLNVIAIKGDIVRARRRAVLCIGGVTAHIRFRQIEDQPAFADIAKRQMELVPKKLAQFLGFGGSGYG